MKTNPSISDVLIAHMKELMLAIALDPIISEQERTERLRRGREYIAAGGRADLLSKELLK